MKIFNKIVKSEPKLRSGRFADFLFNASDEDKERVLREVAHKANEEQRKVFKKAQILTEIAN